MSIPAQAAQQADPVEAAAAAAAVESASPVVGVLVVALTLAGLVMLWRYWRAGVLRPSAVLGPDRTPGAGYGWGTLATFVVGTCVWIGSQAVLGSMKQAQWAAAGNEGRFPFSALTSGELARLTTLPGLAGVLAVAVCLRLFRRDERPVLGATPGLAPNGLYHAIGAVLVILPLIIYTSAAMEWAYRLIEFEHPSEHTMLRAMKEAPLLARWGLIAGAVLVAPLVEEVLFRGLFQTLLVWALVRLSGPGTHRAVAARWLAILAASVLFAVIHDLWSAPAIFVLSVCLGYAYERSGNLWLPIGIHALFNGFETALYLLVIAGR